LKKKRKKDKDNFFVFFICKSKSHETMDFLTNQGNTDTGIRLEIKTIQSNTNTCLVSVAPLPRGIPLGHGSCTQRWAATLTMAVSVV
jgi:hypothetical protein